MNSPKLDSKRRVLLMYITKVSGHRQATVAIQQALRQLDPTIEVPSINGFGYTYPVLEKVVNKAYMSVIKRTPKVWDFLYDNPNVVKNTQSIKNFLHKTSYDKLDVLFEQYHPDTVVCTQAFPCGMFADYKRARGLSTTLIGVLTDFAPHSFWLNEGVDYYVVPSEESKERFIKKGVPPEAIKVFGIPIRNKFAVPLDKSAIAQKLGLDLKLPTILIMGGGQGLGPIKAIVKSLIKVSLPFQMVILTGTNRKIFDRLQKYARKTDKKILLFEYVTNVEDFMDLASLTITKPGGITTAECLAKGLPMVIVNPIPGQEMRNTDFLIKNGIGVRIDDASDIGEEIELLLQSPHRLSAMKQQAYLHAKPHATKDIAQLILNREDSKPKFDYNLTARS